ncbi:hypothetical protein BBO_02056 [Beauveria brongniartii RCEF 3172]|uniref:tRNA splicing endonuclease subunit n=1 Tax=Beauveria brongniartii RCEF 3172 TaxID=1081107 RepID=A0A167IF74_9HYPO|nr:hypothetical protein BBO_02056 [Beauveria brongniartii RCEF 3172]
MADVVVPDIIMTTRPATAPIPPPTETSFRPAETQSTAVPTGEPLANNTVTQAPVPSEADRMPTPISDEPGVETRPVPMAERPAALDNEQDSELSDPDSTVKTPPRGNELEEEIVVRAKDIVITAQPDGDGDEAMAEADGEGTTSHYPKRKRTSIFNDLSESKIEIPTSIRAERPERTALPSTSSKAKPRNSIGGVKGVLVGHWRDSPVPDIENKHAVIGFIDVRDRLRTRIQPLNKAGEPISAEYPLPPGPGGSWVTFDRIYFSDFLVGLDHFQVKEYVRLRSAAVEDSDEERLAAEAEAVKAATIRGRELLQTENPVVAPLMAHGAIPVDANGNPMVIDAKRRRTSNSFVSIAPHEDAAGGPHPLALDPLHGTRPTRVVLGYWKLSSEELPEDRHAVYGILGQNDMFRVKVVRETRDGRYVDGNFPTGAGALWIHWDEVEFEPHIRVLSRPEIKEYCRIRQYQIDRGETIGQRPGRADLHADHRERAAQAADAAAAAVAGSITVPSPPMTNGSGRALFHESEDIERLNRVWARQESLRLRAGSEDAKIYDGVKYERKPTGPFMGKLVSQGTIITIDGEDYVEYRVLTKPSFF